MVATKSDGNANVEGSAAGSHRLGDLLHVFPSFTLFHKFFEGPGGVLLLVPFLVIFIICFQAFLAGVVPRVISRIVASSLSIVFWGTSQSSRFIVGLLVVCATLVIYVLLGNVGPGSKNLSWFLPLSLLESGRLVPGHYGGRSHLHCPLFQHGPVGGSVLGVPLLICWTG